jgi:hypothetical protein
MTKVQVGVENYDFSTYVTKDRWASYWEQVALVTKHKPNSVLVIGKGDGIVVSTLEKMCSRVDTFDIDPDLLPTYVGSVEELSKIVNVKYDLILCCQVLEHLPYAKFDGCIHEIRKVSPKLIISLPYRHWRLFDIRIKVPRISGVIFTFFIPKFFEVFKFNGQHYWEVGTKGYSKARISRDLSKHFSKVFKVNFKEYRYHLFYECT